MCAMDRKAATSTFRADNEDKEIDLETEVKATNPKNGS